MLTIPYLLGEWTTELIISGVAAFIAGLAFIVAIVSAIFSGKSAGTAKKTYELTEVRGIQPYLVFTRAESINWVIQNVGKGPALEILVWHDSDGNGTWKDSIRCYPLAAGERFELQLL